MKTLLEPVHMQLERKVVYKSRTKSSTVRFACLRMDLSVPWQVHDALGL